MIFNYIEYYTTKLLKAVDALEYTILFASSHYRKHNNFPIIVFAGWEYNLKTILKFLNQIISYHVAVSLT